MKYGYLMLAGKNAVGGYFLEVSENKRVNNVVSEFIRLTCNGNNRNSLEDIVKDKEVRNNIKSKIHKCNCEEVNNCYQFDNGLGGVFSLHEVVFLN